MNKTLYSMARSWCIPDSTENSTEELLSWVQERNKNLVVEIHKNRLKDSGVWFYDREEGYIRNRDRSFSPSLAISRCARTVKLFPSPLSFSRRSDIWVSSVRKSAASCIFSCRQRSSRGT